MSTADHERQLWEASEQFVRGEMSSERLDQIELSDKLSRDDATDAIVLQRMRWYLTIIFILFFTLTTISVIITIIVTHNFFSLTIIIAMLPSFSFLFSRISKYYFPKNERTYQMDAIKLQQKMRRKQHLYENLD